MSNEDKQAIICSSRNTAVYHRYRGIGGIKRYVSRMKLTHDRAVRPYMVKLFRNFDGSGELTINFMNARQAECHFAFYIVMVVTVRRWRNLRSCEISEFYEINGTEPSSKVYQLERIWERR